MKIGDLVYDLVIESSKKDQLVQQKIQSWLSENPQLSPEKAKNIIDWFLKVSDKLKLKFQYKAKDKDTGEEISYDSYRPQIYTFLKKFDGNHGEEKFEERFLTDPLKYNAKQAEFLYDEFHPVKTDDADEEVDQVLDPKKRQPTPEKERASKELWYNPNNALINEEGFRVYSIDNQLKSIFYGYYLGTMYSEKNLRGFQWCTTAWSDGSNMYESKRSSRSFYFVIDESKNPDIEKNPEINKFYLSALQVFDTTKTSNKYAITGIDNPGEPPVSQERLLQIYPKLANHLDKLKYEPLSDDELVSSNEVTRINETQGHKYEFSRMPRKLKLKYISLRNSNLQKVESWQSMDEGLKKAYMMSITTDGGNTNIFDKFSSGPILDEIKKNTSEKNYLNIWVKRALGNNEGIGTLYLKTLSTSYQIGARSVKKETTVLVAHYTENIYGLYDKQLGDWIKKGGILYNNYRKVDVDAYIDKENKKRYIVEIFSQNSNEENDRSFYRIYEGISPERKGSEKTKSNFLTRSKWLELSEKLQIVQQDGYGEFKGVDFEKDIDIE